MIGVENLVENGPIINGAPRRIFGVSIRRAPFEGRSAVTRGQQIVSSDVDRIRAYRRKLGEELSAIFHVGEIRLVVSEVCPIGFERALPVIGIHLDSHPLLGPEAGGKRQRQGNQKFHEGGGHDGVLYVVSPLIGKDKTSRHKYRATAIGLQSK